MGDTQSTYEEGEPGQDAAECGVQDVQHADDEKLLKNKGQIAAKSDTSFVEVNGRREDDTNAEADGLETLRENIVVIEKESIKEANNEEDISFDVTEVEAKHDINESFKTFLSKVGLKFTLKRGFRVHGGNQEDGPDGSKSIADQIHDDKTQADAARESQNEDSTHLTEEEATVREDSQNETDLPDEDWTHLNTPSKHDLSSPSCAKEDVTMSPIQRFFTTGIFAGLAKKRMSLEDETMTRELVLQEVGDTVKETTQDEQEDTEIIAVTLADGDQEENPSADMKSEPEAPKEIEGVPSSPLKRLLLGSSLMMMKRQKDAKPSEGEDCKPSRDDSDQLFSPTDIAENDKTKRPAQPTETTVAVQEESPWATFMKLLSPKKRVNRSALNNDDVQTPKPSEEDDTLECRLGNGKDSAVSWDAILCARSQTPLDYDHETPSDDVNAAEAIENYENNADVLASTPKEAASPPEGDVESAWTVFKRLMSPKRKAKPAGERQRRSEPDGHQENTLSAQIIPGWKKRKSVSNKDQETPLCEVNQELGAGDLNSEMPSAVPLSNHNTVETEPKESVVEREPATKTDADLNQDIVPEVTEAAQLLDNLQTDGNEATNEDLANLTEFNGNALSDIPEEGEFTESTKADNLIESTSEAVTAPSYPVDMSLAEDSERISALSQRSEQTSGATTAVVADSQVKVKEELMEQVVESISTMPVADSLCSDKMVSSVSRDALETFAGDSQQHEVQKLKAPITRTDLVVNEMEAAMDGTELSKVKKIMEITPIPTEELNLKEITPPIPPEELATQEIAATISTEEPDTKEVTIPIPTKELDNEEMAPQILTKEHEIKEIKSLIPIKELGTQEMTPPFSQKLDALEIKTTEKVDTKEIKTTSTDKNDTDNILPSIPTKELDTQEITTHTPTEDLDIKEITTAILSQELEAQEITPPIPTEELGTKEIKTLIYTEELHTEEITPTCTETEKTTPSSPIKELDIDEIKLLILTEGLNAEEIIPTMSTSTISTLIQTEELNTKEITCPVLPEELDSQVITAPISTEMPDTEEIKTQITKEEFDIEEITPATRTEEPDTEQIKPSIPTKELGIEEIKSPITSEELDTDTPITTEKIRTPIQIDEINTKEITPPILQEDLETQEMAPPIPTEELNLKESTMAIRDKELETQEITPPIPAEELDTKEIQTKILTVEFDIKDITPRDTEEMTPSIPTRELEIEEIKSPVPTEELDTDTSTTTGNIRTPIQTKEITPLILKEEFDTQERASPIPTAELDTQERASPKPTEELDMEEISTSSPTKAQETEEITPPLPTETPNTEEITPPIYSEDLHSNDITSAIPTEELATEDIRAPTPTEEYDTEEITPPIIKGLKMEKIQTPFLPEELDTNKITTLIPAAGLNAEEFTPQLPIQKLYTKEITPLIPTQETETEVIMPLIPIDKSDTEEMTPSIPTMELSLEACAPPIPTEDFESKESSSRVLTEEVDTTGISPTIPSEELDREEIIAAIATEEKYHSENIKPQVDTEELDTEELTTDETKETNHSKSDDNINELDSIDEIHEFVDCLTGINQGEYSEQLSESKDVGAEDDLEDLATNQGENKASEVNSQQPVSMAEHERRDGGKRYLVESAKQPQVEDHIPVVDELQRSSDILDNTTNLHEGVTAESIINAPEPETIDHTDHKETDLQQNTLRATTIHLEEQKVKVTSHNFPAAYMEDLEPTTEILSEPILNSVDVSGAQTEAMALQQGSVQLDEDEMLSKKVVSELKEMTELLTDLSIEPENKDVAKEPVESGSTDETEAVQATLLVSEKAEPDKKTVAGLPQDKAIVAPEIESIQEQQVLVATPKTQFESDTADVQHDELKEDIHGEDPPGEEVKDDNVPLPETDAEETAKDQKTINDTQIKFVQEDKDKEGRDLSVKVEDISESILAQETLIAEAKYRPAPLTEDELVSADQQAKSDLSPEREVVQETCAKSDEHKEVREDIHPPKTMTEECGEEMAPQLQTILESAKDDEVAVGASEIERGKEIEETQSKQSIQTDSVVVEETINAEIQITEELREETMRLTEVQAESNQKAVDVIKTEPNADQVMAEEGKATTEDIADKRKVSVEVKEEAVALSEMNVDPQEKDDEAVDETDNIKMCEVLASEEANVELLQSEETTEGSLVEESLPSELKEGAEPMSELTLQPGNINMKQVTVLTEGTLAKKSDDNQNGAMKSSAETEALLAVRDEVQEPEEVPAVETETVEEVAMPGLEITQQSITQTFPKETLEEEIPKPETGREIVSEVEQTKPPPDQALDKQKNLEPEITVDDRPQDAKEGEEDGTLQVTEAHISLHQEEKNCAQSLENVIFEEIADICGTLADKVKLEARASDVENRTTGENCDLPNVEATIATGEYALVTQVTMCHFKEVSTALPDRIRTPSCMQEPLMGSVVPESTETAVNESPMMTDDLAEMARIGNEAVMMHVPATVMEANHSIQVQVVQMETTTAERSLDHMSEIEIREKGFIDIGNRNIEGVEFVSASLGVEDVIHEDYTVMCHEIAPHVKENQLETLRQKVLKGAKNVELGKVDGNMELRYTEHACKGETLEEALHEDATPQSLEVPKFQERLEEKEDSNWALQAEKSMAATDKAGKAPVAKEEPCILKNRHKDTEPTKEGHETFVVQSSFHQMEPADCQKEKNPIEKGVQPQEALSQTDLGEYQDVMTNEEDFQIPKVEEPLSERGTEELLSLLDPLASLKTTEQSEVSVQAILALDSVVSIDNHKQTGISEENVEVQQTVKPSFPKEPDGKQTSAALIKKSCQKPKTEEPVFKKESNKDQKQTDRLEKHVQASKNQEPLTQKESIDTQKQVEVTKEHEQARDVQVPSPQKESIEIQKQTELQDKYFQASETQEPISQKESSEGQKQTELQDKLVQASENEKPLPQKEYTETQKQMGLTEEHEQVRDIQVASLQKESTETQKETELKEKLVQAGENEEPLPQKESTEIQQKMELQDKYFQASETQDPIAQNESTETQKQMKLQDKLVQASENEKPLPQKEYTETQKQMGLKEELEHARDIQVASLQKESTETQKETELKEKLVQAGENHEPLPQKESSEIQQQMELKDKLVQASENQEPLPQKMSTKIQQQMELQENYFQASETQEPIAQKESNETQKQMKLTEEHEQARDVQVPSPQKESIEIHKQTELQDKYFQASETQEPISQKESSESQKQTELQDKLVQASENEKPLPQKEYTETQKQMGLTEEHEQVRDIQVASLQKESTETQKETEQKEKLVQAGENEEPLPQKESTEIQQKMELQDKYFQARETQDPIAQNESTETQKQMELQDKLVQASENEKPLPQKEYTETQKQMGLKEELEHARVIQVASLQKESTETQKEMELKEKLVQAGENHEPLPQKESSEIQQQMELKDNLVQASENQEPLPQKMSTKIQQQMELQENYFQASETQEPIAQKESNETQKQMKLTEEHEQARDVQVPSPQKESTENQKQMELLEKCVQTRENQDSVPQKESTKPQKQTEQTKEAPEKEMVSLPKEPVNGQKQAVRTEETSKLAQELKSTDNSVTTGSSVHLDSGFLTVETKGAAEEIFPMLTVKVIEEIQSEESIEPVEKYAATPKETPNVQTSETLQTAERPETVAPIKEAEDEQDIWMEAKEEIEIPGETNALSPQDASPRHDLNQQTKTVHEAESEPMPDTDSRAESESEGDNFDIAFDNSKLESAAVME